MVLILGIFIVYAIVQCIVNNIYGYKCNNIARRLSTLNRLLVSIMITIIILILFLTICNDKIEVSYYNYRESYYLKNMNDKEAEEPIYYKHDKGNYTVYALDGDEEREITIPAENVSITHDNNCEPYITIEGFKIEYPELGNILLGREEDQDVISGVKLVIPYENNDYFKYRNETNIY